MSTLASEALLRGHLNQVAEAELLSNRSGREPCKTNLEGATWRESYPTGRSLACLQPLIATEVLLQHRFENDVKL
jgi:hypothetical protein